MALKYPSLLLLLISIGSIRAQTRISGQITDRKGSPLEGANIYLEGTLDGATSDRKGFFAFDTRREGRVTLVVRFIGFQEYEKEADVKELSQLAIILKEKSFGTIDEITVTASTFSLGKSVTLEKMNPLDVVMTATSDGDIFGALRSLPGVQKLGESGKLYVRGGEDRETQVFIDGMHVLVPYTNSGQNSPVRSRFSPFLFKGINFSLGGYSSEYGQALSAVLPMETEDVSPNTEIGLTVSPIDVSVGGTYAFVKSAVSGNLSYTDLSGYNAVFPDRSHWIRPYQKRSAHTQYKSALGKEGLFKLYVGYDHTGFRRDITDRLDKGPLREFEFDQDNYYLNATYHTRTKSGWKLFFGTAFSGLWQRDGSVRLPGDRYEERQGEWQLKTTARKSFSGFYKLNTGLESYIGRYRDGYTDPGGEPSPDRSVNHNRYAAYLDNQFRLAEGLYTNVSGRLEHSAYNGQWTLSPRLSLNYVKAGFQISGIYGRCYQAPENKVLAAAKSDLAQESAEHYILGASYRFDGRMLRLEGYYKDYRHLNLLQNAVYTDRGYSRSTGLDLYFSDDTSVENLKYTLSYSYNDSKRLYKDYPVASVPLFSTAHNGTLSLKYYIPKLKTYLGTAYSYTSGRPYHNPNVAGFVNGRTGSYQSLDMNLTFLLGKKLILYTSLTNVLNRKNVFGYTYAKSPDPEGVYKDEAIRARLDRTFYITLLIALKNAVPYDVSSF